MIKDNKLLYLAPLAGISDAPYRLLCQEQGADVCVTEMVSAQGYVSAKKHCEAYESLLERIPEEKNVIVQIFGTKPEFFYRAANRLSELNRFDGIDINMGCPARKVTNGGAGSALMDNIALAQRIVEATIKGTCLPVSVKMRLGFENNNAVDFAKAIEDAGARLICVHGRTRAQQYSGIANWEEIAKVKESVSVPVIANGDIFSAEQADKALKVTNADGLMIGRGALGNPWIFSQIRDYFNDTEPKLPSKKMLIDMALRHALLLIERKGENRGIIEMRKHFAWYLKGLRGAALIRTKINCIKTFDEIKSLLEEFLNEEIDLA